MRTLNLQTFSNAIRYFEFSYFIERVEKLRCNCTKEVTCAKQAEHNITLFGKN